MASRTTPSDRKDTWLIIEGNPVGDTLHPTCGCLRDPNNRMTQLSRTFVVISAKVCLDEVPTIHRVRYPSSGGFTKWIPVQSCLEPMSGGEPSVLVAQKEKWLA